MVVINDEDKELLWWTQSEPQPSAGREIPCWINCALSLDNDCYLHDPVLRVRPATQAQQSGSGYLDEGWVLRWHNPTI